MGNLREYGGLKQDPQHPRFTCLPSASGSSLHKYISLGTAWVNILYMSALGSCGLMAILRTIITKPDWMNALSDQALNFSKDMSSHTD